jgi:hypothetical protein
MITDVTGEPVTPFFRKEIVHGLRGWTWKSLHKSIYLLLICYLIIFCIVIKNVLTQTLRECGYTRAEYGTTNVAPTQKDQPLLSSKRWPYLQTRTWSWNEQKFGHKSTRGPKPGTTVLTRTSSNLLICYAMHVVW